MKIDASLIAAQALSQKPVNHVSELYHLAGSRATAYRTIDKLQALGFAQKQGRGYFVLRDSFFQPYHILLGLLPSLRAIGRARFFGKAYNESDVGRARQLLDGMVTLDYRAYELTGFQTPERFFVYVEDTGLSANALIEEGFSEGREGRVAILPTEGEFQNEIQRVYSDCLAFGGRGVLDAVAIELKYGDQLATKGTFPVELVTKVREDLPR